MQWRFDQNDRDGEYTVDLAFQLSGPVFSVVDVQLETAETVEGVSLLQKRRLNYSSPDLRHDKVTVTYRANLNSPPPACKGIARISGVLRCSSIESETWVELINGDLVVGAKGSRFGATIDAIERPKGLPERLILKSNAELGENLSFRIEGSSGERLELQVEGQTLMDDVCFRTLVVSGSLPKRGKLSVRIRDALPLMRFPFAISDLTLLGQPKVQK